LRLFDFSAINKFVFKNSYKLSADNIRFCLFLIFDKIAENIEVKEIKKNLSNSINKYQLPTLLSINKISDSNLKSKLKKYLYKKYLKIIQQLNRQIYCSILIVVLSTAIQIKKKNSELFFYFVSQIFC